MIELVRSDKDVMTIHTSGDNYWIIGFGKRGFNVTFQSQATSQLDSSLFFSIAVDFEDAHFVLSIASGFKRNIRHDKENE